MKSVLLHIFAHIIVPASVLALLVAIPFTPDHIHDPLIWEWPAIIGLGAVALSYTSKKFLDRYVAIMGTTMLFILVALSVVLIFHLHALDQAHTNPVVIRDAVFLLFTLPMMGLFALTTGYVYEIAAWYQKKITEQNP